MIFCVIVFFCVCLFCLWSGRGWPGGGRGVRSDALQRPGCQAELLPEGRVPAKDLQEPRHAVPASGEPRGVFRFTLRFVAFRFVSFRFVVFRYVTLRYVTFHYFASSCVALCHATLRCVTQQEPRHAFSAPGEPLGLLLRIALTYIMFRVR